MLVRGSHPLQGILGTVASLEKGILAEGIKHSLVKSSIDRKVEKLNVFNCIFLTKQFIF